MSESNNDIIVPDSTAHAGMSGLVRESTFESVSVIGYEWCRPVQTARLSEYVTVASSFGWIALSRVEMDSNSGEVRRVMLKPDEMRTADK